MFTMKSLKALAHSPKRRREMGVHVFYLISHPICEHPRSDSRESRESHFIIHLACNKGSVGFSVMH